MKRLTRIIFSILLIALPSIADTPFELTGNKDIWLSGSSLLLASAGAFMYLQDTPQKPVHIKENILPFDRCAAGIYRPGIAKVSDAVFGLCLMMPLLTLTQTHDDVSISTQGMMYSEAVLGTTGLILLAKGFTERPRPYVYAPDVPEKVLKSRSAYRSFFSAHAALSFCSVCYAASIFQKSDPDSKWVTPLWTAGLSAASLTSILRVAAGRHFPTDVLTGAAVGSVIGWGIPKLHESKKKSSSFRVALTIPISS